MSAIEIRDTAQKGRGIFARERIPADAVLDEAAVTIVAAGELTGTALDEYRFEWDEEHEAVAFGVVSLANHSPDPNAWVEMDPESRLMRLIALRPIAPGEEITVDYGCELWFDPAA